MSWVAMLGFH